MAFLYYYNFRNLSERQTESQNEVTVSKISKIENFKFPDGNGDDTYYVLYPADSRIEENKSLIKEIDESGKVLKEFLINDSDFRRINIFQKPTQPNILYGSLFGEPKIDDYFYTFDLEKKVFEKKKNEYFKYPVGIGSLNHYGSDILFQTLVSHKTGEQNYDEKTQSFSVSISNYDSKQSFETELGHVPSNGPLLLVNNKVMYGSLGYVDSDLKRHNGDLAIIDLDKQSVTYETFEKLQEGLFPIFSNKQSAYVLSESGTLYVTNGDGDYREFYPFKDIVNDVYYHPEALDSLALDDNSLILSVLIDEQITLGHLQLEDDPSFTIIKNEDLIDSSNIKILYQDFVNRQIYMVLEKNEKSFVLIIDSLNFKTISKIPIQDGYLVDFVVKSN